MIGQVLGHYRVDERIGAGGMGVVYRAYDTRLHRPVAIKLIGDPAVGSETAHRRILTEARMASALNHPNICTVHEVGEVEDRVFLVMEYVEGQRIDAMIPAAGLPPELVVRHGRCLADALDHAHSRGVLHRDLKSSNVIVTPGGVAKVLDFGIAQRAASAEDDTHTATTRERGSGDVTGTLAYVSPEALSGEPASAENDVWSLGVLLYEMASGRLPFVGRTAFELTAAILREPPSPLPATVPPALAAVIHRCLEKDPSDRYARAGELRAALDAALADTHAHGAGQSRWQHWTPWIAGGAVAAAVVVVVVLAALPWARAHWNQALSPGRGGAEPPRLALLLSSEQRILDPALSRDGRMMAYVAEDELGRRDLYVSQVSGAGRLRLTDDPAVESLPRFSPDGQRLVFTRLQDGIPSVCLVPTLGGAITTAISRAGEASWSPDGARLAFVAHPDGQLPSLMTSLADGSDPRTLRTAEHAYPFMRNTAWSVGGEQIAFVVSSGGASAETWLIPSGGGVARRLANEGIGVFSAEPVFSPDGRHVIVSSNRGGATNLWSIPITDGVPEQLTTGPGPDQSPSVAADGLLVFLNSHWRSALTVIDLARGERRTLLTHGPYLWAPAVSPGGREIAFSRMETNGLWHIWIVPTGGGTARQVTFGESGEIYPRFTPDGRTIVFHTWAAPHRIWKISIDGGPPVAITQEGASDEAWADVSPDGQRLAFVRIVDGVEQVFVAPMAGGPARLAAPGPATTPRWSPDGRSLAVGQDRSYRNGISIVDVDRELSRPLSTTGGWPVWWPDGRRIGFLALGPDGNQEVRTVDLTGQLRPPGTWPKFVGANQVFDVFPGGAAAASALAVHLADEIWMLRR